VLGARPGPKAEATLARNLITAAERSGGGGVHPYPYPSPPLVTELSLFDERGDGDAKIVILLQNCTAEYRCVSYTYSAVSDLPFNNQTKQTPWPLVR
jgi:hypothetical protein